jgi:hypothetical protein
VDEELANVQNDSDTVVSVQQEDGKHDLSPIRR